MTLSEAATLLGLRPDTLRQQIANGSLKARKVGRDWHVTPREVERYRRESRRSQRPPVVHEFADGDALGLEGRGDGA
jgi:excisionase family DNA binding protein